MAELMKMMKEWLGQLTGNLVAWLGAAAGLVLGLWAGLPELARAVLVVQAADIATGLACALAYLKGGGLKELEAAVSNMAASITGMICSGGNHCCCLKVIAASDSAFTAAELAVSGAMVSAPHGILEPSAEKTMQNLGLIADPGMTETERVIIEIMQGKGK